MKRDPEDKGARARMAAVLSQRGNQLVMTKRMKSEDPYELIQVTPGIPTYERL